MKSRVKVSGQWTWLACVALVGTVAPANGQAPAFTPPRHFAIENARIVTVSGATIERGTIVIENGLIAAVGENVSVPPEAWAIDGSGLTVYPGLIDALSTVGVPASMRNQERRRGGGPGGGGGPPGAGADPDNFSRGPEDRPATMSWVNAADDFEVGADGVGAWRSGGFTTIIASPERGLFPGQPAMMNLAGENANDMVVKTPVALRVNFDKGQGFAGFPNSLMGSIAYVRQLFFDASRYDLAWTIYDESPAGLERPEYDRALEPLRVALNTSVPVLMPGNESREIHRAIRLGDEVGARTIVYGAQQGYDVVDALASNGAVVLVNIDWPKADPNGDPDAEPSLRELRYWDRAATTPGLLADAGVQFAFYSGGAPDARTVRANVHRAIQSGLSADQAIRALTLAPAEIFGVADRMGSLDAGKIANVVVTDGDLFDSGTSIRMVFVDGHKFDVEPETVAANGGRGRNRGADPWNAPAGAPIPMVADRGPLSQGSVTVIQNATIMTASNGTIENGSIVIRDGKIVEVGQNVTVPNGANVIDASGKYVIPGIIDAHSHMAADAINEGAIAVSSMVGIEDVINPEQITIYRALAGGVTSANVLHGSANPIGGKNAVIKLRWGADAAGLLMQGAPPGIKFALGENTKRDRNPDRYPATRMGVMDVIRQAFVDAQEYQTKWRRYEETVAAGGRAIPPARDLQLETLVQILDGERMVHAHSYRADEILQLLRVAEEFGFKIATLQHVLEGYRVADEIAEHGAGASTFSDWWAYKVEAYEAIPYNAALMTERGVTVSINSDSGEEVRHLNQEAGKMMKWGGLSEEEALRLVTVNPAQQLDISDRVGSIEVGKDADIAIYTGHPLSAYGVVEQTFVDGMLYFDRQIDIERREALQEEKRLLLEKHTGTGGETERVTTDVTADPQEGVR